MTSPFCALLRLLSCCLLIATLLPGCADQRRVPRIEPVLWGWEQAHEPVDLLLHAFNTGTMRILPGAMARGGSWQEASEIPVPAFVVEHESKGLLVFDTGYSPAVRDSPEQYLGPLLAALDLCDTEPGQSLPEQMSAAGLDPADVGYVAVSHLHFDHAGSVEAFAGATLLLPRREEEGAWGARWFEDFFFEEDWDDIERRTVIDYAATEPWATFDGHYDVFGDGSAVLVDLHGHTAGTQGLVLRGRGGVILLTGDAAYTEASWRYVAQPAFAQDMDDWWQQAWRINRFVGLLEDEGGVLVVPGHDLRSVGAAARADLRYHEFVAVPAVQAGAD
jgi:glyoxylase-like metal-dependent hydrolase (beta-lactamase superfamily II)